MAKLSIRIVLKLKLLEGLKPLLATTNNLEDWFKIVIHSYGLMNTELLGNNILNDVCILPFQTRPNEIQDTSSFNACELYNVNM